MLCAARCLLYVAWCLVLLVSGMSHLPYIGARRYVLTKVYEFRSHDQASINELRTENKEVS